MYEHLETEQNEDIVIQNEVDPMPTVQDHSEVSSDLDLAPIS